MKRRAVIPLFLLTTLVLLPVRADSSGVRAEADLIVVSDASVQPVPPVATTTAAYMVLTHNGMGGEGGRADVGLVSVASPCCRAAELHRSGSHKGLMKMARVHEVVIKAGETVRMAPGGLHIMLIGLNEPVRRGDTVPITLTFRDGTSVTVSARVGTVTSGK